MHGLSGWSGLERLHALGCQAHGSDAVEIACRAAALLLLGKPASATPAGQACGCACDLPSGVRCCACVCALRARPASCVDPPCRVCASLSHKTRVCLAAPAVCRASCVLGGQLVGWSFPALEQLRGCANQVRTRARGARKALQRRHHHSTDGMHHPTDAPHHNGCTQPNGCTIQGRGSGMRGDLRVQAAVCHLSRASARGRVPVRSQLPAQLDVRTRRRAGGARAGAAAVDSSGKVSSAKESSVK